MIPPHKNDLKIKKFPMKISNSGLKGYLKMLEKFPT